jgi:hypothetical protein
MKNTYLKNNKKQEYTYDELVSVLGKPEELEEMIKNGANVNIKSPEDDPILIKAFDYPSALQLLINYGADINALDKWCSPIIIHSYNKLEALKLLLDSGAIINYGIGCNDHVLMSAFWSLEALKAIVAHGADIDKKDVQGTPLIHYAFSCGLDVVKNVVECGADFNTTLPNGNSLIFNSLNHSGVLQYLIEKGVNPIVTNESGFNLLEISINQCFGTALCDDTKTSGFNNAIYLIGKGFSLRAENLYSESITDFTLKFIKHLAEIIPNIKDSSYAKALRNNLKFYDQFKTILNDIQLKELKDYTQIIEDTKVNLFNFMTGICKDLDSRNANEKGEEIPYYDDKGNVKPSLPNELICHIFSNLNLKDVDYIIPQQTSTIHDSTEVLGNTPITEDIV